MSTVSTLNNLSGFAHNPRGNIWMNDESGFGHKLLKKMGWSKGKGLGKDENGIKENIKVKVKGKNSGVGWKDESFLQVQNTEYDSLLKSINEACTGEKGTSTVDAGHKEKKSSSLEQRSQHFKNRLHFHKFVRGKDLSRYSEKDMKSIFILNKPVEEEKEENLHTATEVSNTVDTYTSQLSVTDYFAGKMDKKKVLSVYDEVSSSKNGTERSANDDSLFTSTKECVAKRKKGYYDDETSVSKPKRAKKELKKAKKHKVNDGDELAENMMHDSQSSELSNRLSEASEFLKFNSSLKSCLKHKTRNYNLKVSFNKDVIYNFIEPRKNAECNDVVHCNSADNTITSNENNSDNCNSDLTQKKVNKLKRKKFLRYFDVTNVIEPKTKSDSIDIANLNCIDDITDNNEDCAKNSCNTSKAKVEVSGNNTVASSDKEIKTNNFLKLDSALKKCLKSKVGNFSLKPLFNNKFSIQLAGPKKKAKPITVENGNATNFTNIDNKSNNFDGSCNPINSEEIANINENKQTEELVFPEAQKKALKRKKEAKRDNFVMSSAEVEESECHENIIRKRSKRNYDELIDHQQTPLSKEVYNFLCNQTGLPKRNSKYYNEWVATQRRALKMDHYRNMCINIMKDEVLKTSSLATIKGYGNCGLEE